MKEGFLNLNNKFFSFMEIIGDLMILNLLFIICCLPIITIGSSISAMYSACMKLINNEGYLVRVFFEAFKKNFKPATIIWILFFLCGIVFMIDLQCLNIFLDVTNRIYSKVIFVTLGVVQYMIFCYIFPMISKFDNTLINYIKNSFYMSIKHILLTVGILIVNMTPLILYLFGGYYFSYILILFVLFGFSLTAYINSYIFERIFINYM
jgi:Predicted integral membrane protein